MYNIITEYLGLQGENCQNSFIVIANSFRFGEPLNVDRFCGSSFNATISKFINSLGIYKLCKRFVKIDQ